MAETPIADRSIHILTIESDPLILSGLVTCLNRFPDLQVATEAENVARAWQILTNSGSEIGSLAEARSPWRIDLVLFGLPLAVDIANPGASIAFCQQVKARYPDLPILLLATPQNRDLSRLFELGIPGCCLRGSSILDLVLAIRQVAAGQPSWAVEILQRIKVGTDNSSISLPERWRLTSLQQIETTLTKLNDRLYDFPDRLTKLDRLILTGRKRELNTARWLVKQLFSVTDPVNSSLDPRLPTAGLVTSPSPQISRWRSLSEGESSPLPQSLFEQIAAKLQSGLNNLTPIALEIDILRQDKKRELFYLILRQFEGMLDELRFSQVTIEQLAVKQSGLLQDLWRSIVTDFFGRYHTLSIADSHIEIIPVIIQDAQIVYIEILAKIPQSIELLNYLLFKTPLIVDTTISDPDSQISEDRACLLLENLTIQMANAVMQPLLNRFGNLESIKSGFYDRQLLSSREIERFRNELSWRYRIDRYIGEPQAIFESRYRLFVFTIYGIDRIAIYAPRPQELAQLGGLPLVVTLALETRDALSPRLKMATTFFGSSIVYLLTEIIGRGIGLIGRGVIKGVGNIWQESKRNP
jgi:DNA-binding NarL/FixJ family response regulator